MADSRLFPHQAYLAEPPKAPHFLLSAAPGPPVSSDEFVARMQAVGDALRAGGVSHVYLVHGTFVGPDALGLLAELERALPKASAVIRRFVKRVVDKVAGEAGNYPPSFARLFESSIARPGAPRIPVKLFNWSSENHHIGRADGAIRLIAELSSLKLKPGKRVLLWGHSHAGNVFALATHLLSGNVEAQRRFFDAAQIYYRWPLIGCVDIPVWNQVRQLLEETPAPLSGVHLDCVTFGTPIRYGWNGEGYSQLLHFVHHRPSEGLPEYQAPFPPKWHRVMSAADGDYVQQLGIAGTNIMPSFLQWRAWMADNRLNRLLQADDAVGGTIERFRAGKIVADAGTTLLVDYGLPSGSITRHLAGHAVYTRKKWLLFHAEEVARRFYTP